MALMNLSQAKGAIGTPAEIKYIYNGSSSWPIPVSADKVGSNKVIYSEKVNSISAAAKSVSGAPAKQESAENYDVPMFVPTNKEGPVMDDGNIMGPSDNYTGKTRPMHMFNVDTRGHYLGKHLGFGYPGVGMQDSWTGTYCSYFWTWVCFALMIITFFVNPMISAVFAFLWGHYWSEFLCAFGSEITWFKGRSVIVAQ